MKVSRRAAMTIAAGTASSLVLPAVGQEAWPSRPFHVYVGFPAGSGADIIARYFANKLQSASRQTVVVENKPGANGNIAIGLATRAKPDGQTILFSSNSTIVAGDLLYKDLGFDPQRDLTPAALFCEVTFFLAVPSDSPVKDVGGLTEFLKQKKRAKFGYANHISQVAAEYYKSLGGFQAEPVSYKTGADALRDLTSGEVDFVIIDGTFGFAQFKAGRIKALAVTSTTRHPSLPDVPTMQEAGFSDLDFSSWWGAYLPSGTPPDRMDRIGEWMIKIAEADETREFLLTAFGAPLKADRRGADARIKRESARWTIATSAAGIVPR